MVQLTWLMTAAICLAGWAAPGGLLACQTSPSEQEIIPSELRMSEPPQIVDRGSQSAEDERLPRSLRLYGTPTAEWRSHGQLPPHQPQWSDSPEGRYPRLAERLPSTDSRHGGPPHDGLHSPVRVPQGDDSLPYASSPESTEGYPLEYSPSAICPPTDRRFSREEERQARTPTWCPDQREDYSLCPERGNQEWRPTPESYHRPLGYPLTERPSALGSGDSLEYARELAEIRRRLGRDLLEGTLFEQPIDGPPRDSNEEFAEAVTEYLDGPCECPTRRGRDRDMELTADPADPEELRSLFDAWEQLWSVDGRDRLPPCSVMEPAHPWPHDMQSGPHGVRPVWSEQPCRPESSGRQGDIGTLRQIAAELDCQANRLEEMELFEQADALRQSAQQLRLDAREISTAGRECHGRLPPGYSR